VSNEMRVHFVMISGGQRSTLIGVVIVLSTIVVVPPASVEARASYRFWGNASG